MPCILLHRVEAGDELQEVAAGVVIQPRSREMHHTRMDEDNMKVKVVTVVSTFFDIDPPIQPPGADGHMVLGKCPNWVTPWPKNQIRLGGGSS